LGEHLPYKQGVACSSHAPPKGKAPVQGAFSLSGPATARGECKRFRKRFIRYEPVITQLKGALRGRLRLEPTEPGGELVRLLLGVLVTPQQEGHLTFEGLVSLVSTMPAAQRGEPATTEQTTEPGAPSRSVRRAQQPPPGRKTSRFVGC
jgi:hypothetical protein